MIGRLLLRSGSKYLTIYQYLELGVTTKGETVRQSLEELEKLLGETDNKAAHQNIADVRKIFDEIVADGILDNDTTMAQSVILIKLELRLNEKTIYGDDVPSGNDVTSAGD